MCEPHIVLSPGVAQDSYNEVRIIFRGTDSGDPAVLVNMRVGEWRKREMDLRDEGEARMTGFLRLLSRKSGIGTCIDGGGCARER